MALPRIRPLLAFSLGAGFALAAAAVACDATEAQPAQEADAAADVATTDSGRGVDAGSEAAAAPSTCAITRAFVEGCGEDLTCGKDKFDAWCDANDRVINSEAFRRAEAMCLTKSRCDGTVRRDCECKSYASATPTAAQKALVAAYCQTCEPSDTAGCAARAVTYDVLQGPSSVTDLFVAAWELADPLVEEIQTKCTGAALDAGAPDGGAADGGDGGAPAACAKAFGMCAGDVYIAHLPDCPQ